MGREAIADQVLAHALVLAAIDYMEQELGVRAASDPPSGNLTRHLHHLRRQLGRLEELTRSRPGPLSDTESD